MLNLCLHCGSRHVERDQIERCPTPTRTDTWVPIPHFRLLEQVEATLTGAGLKIVNQAHAMPHDGLRYFGLMQVTNGHSHQDYGMVLGLRNSHDKSFPASLAVGSGVFVCDNMAFSAEVVIARRHTVFIERDLPGLVAGAVGRLGDLRQQQDDRIEAYKATKVTHTRAHDMIVRAVDARVVPVTAVPEVLQEWRRPRHAEFAQGGQTAWRLFNAFTEAVKGRNLEALPRRTQALHGLMDVLCGVGSNAN
ncbi:MAG: DUF932 domain-containing protein [Planctomycetaceae bacterium]|nr:DUF945 domain-containing protein [Planctomycetaceae bacterium]